MEMTEYAPLNRILEQLHIDHIEQTPIAEEIQKEKKVINENVCPRCGGTGLEPVEGKVNTFKKCKCAELNQAIKLWNESDMKFDSMEKTWANYIATSKTQEQMKNIATSYFLNFEKIKDTEYNSIMFMGQSGSGKTHLLSATAYKLIQEKHIGVIYMSWIEATNKLKQEKLNDPDAYKRDMNRYKNAKVLFIDDLFKAKYTDTDIAITFEIINNRINRKLPIMLSSELSIDELKIIDNATTGRLFNASRFHRLEIKGGHNDYRLKGYYETKKQQMSFKTS